MKYPEGTICQYCGYENPQENVFCGGCGKRLILVPSLEMEERDDDYFTYKWLGTKVSISKETFVFANYIFTPIVLLILGLMYFFFNFLLGGIFLFLSVFLLPLGMKSIRDAGYGYGAILSIGALWALILFIFSMLDVSRIIS